MARWPGPAPYTKRCSTRCTSPSENQAMCSDKPVSLTALVASPGARQRFARQMNLVELPTGRIDTTGHAVVVQHLPARAGVSAARNTRVSPDFAGVVQLEQAAAVGDDI